MKRGRGWPIFKKKKKKKKNYFFVGKALVLYCQKNLTKTNQSIWSYVSNYLTGGKHPRPHQRLSATFQHQPYSNSSLTMPPYAIIDLPKLAKSAFDLCRQIAPTSEKKTLYVAQLRARKRENPTTGGIPTLNFLIYRFVLCH